MVKLLQHDEWLNRIRDFPYQVTVKLRAKVSGSKIMPQRKLGLRITDTTSGLPPTDEAVGCQIKS